MTVMFCCNSPDDGQFTGRCSGVQVADMEFVNSESAKDPAIKILVGTVRFCRLVLPFRNHKIWAGNWCWDVVQMKATDVARLLNSKTFRSIFTCEGGPVDLADAWERGNLDFEDLLNWECRASLTPTPEEPRG